MKALVFPGQGAQYPGMGKSLSEESAEAKALFAKANDILGFDIATIMFEGPAEELVRTSVTQPAIYIHSVVSAMVHGAIGDAAMTAGHSLGEFSALAAAGAISRPSMVCIQLRFASWWRKNPPPPMPLDWGSTTVKASIIAIAASVAEPPACNISKPAFVASGCIVQLAKIMAISKAKVFLISVPHIQRV